MVSLKASLLFGIFRVLPFVARTAADTLTVTITDYPGFLSQRQCAFQGPGCLVNGALANLNNFGCPTSPLENACYCRADVLSSNVKSISSCVSLKCSGNSVDVQSATSIYLAYCSSNGYIEAIPTTVSMAQQSSTTNAAVPGTDTSAGVVTQTKAPSATSSTPAASSSSGSGGLSVGGIIGVAVSVACSVLGLIFGIGFKIWQHKKEQKKKAQKIAQEQRNAAFNHNMEPKPWVTY